VLSRSLRTALSVAAVGVASLAAAAPSQAHDSLAPAGANHAWLPAHDAWVMQHWVPFDEAVLHDALDVDNQGLERWMRDDHRTIAQLAERRKGLAADTLADQLLAPRKGTVSDDQYAVLHERTMRMLTQGHLAQHVLFHYFHGTYALENTKTIFGVDRKTYKRVRLAGATPVQIGRRGGRTTAQVDRGMRRILRYGRDVGTDDGSQTPAQGAYMLRRRTELLSCFLRRPMPKLDPGNPYGDPNNGHGPHGRTNRNGLRSDSKEARARRHRSSCWHEPVLPPATTEPTAGAAAQPGLQGGWKVVERDGESALCHLAGV
jgi:hypothetical protein